MCSGELFNVYLLEGVDLFNKLNEDRKFSQEVLGNEDATIVHLVQCSFMDNVTKVCDNLFQSFTSELFWDQDYVRVGLETAFDSLSWRWASSCEHEIPILDGGSAIGQHVTDKLWENLGSRVEPNKSLDILVIDIAINTSWCYDNLGVGHSSRQLGSISHGVVITNDHQTV